MKLGEDLYKFSYSTLDNVSSTYHDRSLSVDLTTAGLNKLVSTFNSTIDLSCARCLDDFHRIPCYLDYRPVNLPCTVESVRILYDFIDHMNLRFRERGFTVNSSLMRLVAPNELQNIFAGIPCPRKSRAEEHPTGKPGGGPRSPKARKRSYDEMSGARGSGISAYKRSDKQPETTRVKVELLPGNPSPDLRSKYITKSTGILLINSQYGENSKSPNSADQSMPEWKMDLDDTNDDLFNVSPYSPSLLSSPEASQSYSHISNTQELPMSPISQDTSRSFWKKDHKFPSKYKSFLTSTLKRRWAFKLEDPPARNRPVEGIKSESEGEGENERPIKREESEEGDLSEGPPSENDNEGSMPKKRHLN